MALSRLRAFVWVLIVVGGAAAAAVWTLSTYGLVSDHPPGRMETAVARRLVVLSIPSSVRQQANPYAGDAHAWQDGADHFAEHCAVCHGRSGRGDSDLARKMYPPVPDLADPAIQRMSDGALFAVIQNGVRWTGMPAFRQTHTAEETWKLVAFVRRVPTLTAADLSAGVAQHDHAGREGAAAVAMDGTGFSPAELHVSVGETVTWTNKDPFPHNVTSSKAHVHSPDIPAGGTWSFTPETAGTFHYVCTLHPGMQGVLVVEQRSTK